MPKFRGFIALPPVLAGESKTTAVKNGMMEKTLKDLKFIVQLDLVHRTSSIRNGKKRVS